MDDLNIRKQFKIANKITYLDSGALVLKPKVAIDATIDFYENHSVSHRTSDTPLGIKSQQVINLVREKVAKLTDSKTSEVIFTSGATDSLNRIALMLEKFLKKGDEILLSSYNHSSNFVPWINIANRTGAEIKVSKSKELEKEITPKTKIIAFGQVTNNFDIKLNLDKIYKKAKEIGAVVINDAAQALVNEKVSHKNSDVIAFSANKFYGPTGLGCLIIKENLLKKLSPVTFGGGAIVAIEDEKCFLLKDSIQAFEPGTPNLAGIFMFNKSLDFFENIGGYKTTSKILRELSNYVYDQLSKIKDIEIYTNRGSQILLFNIGKFNSQDIAHYLGTKNVYVRAGTFCAQYLKNIKQEKSYVRVSLGIYNNKKDIDKLVKELKNGGDFIVI